MAVSKAVPHVLVVAGTDSSGGAGITRDVETLSVFGVRACLAVTAVTAQTDEGVGAIEIMPAQLVERQMRAALAGGHVRAVKLGMLASPEIAYAVCRVLADLPHLPVVVDPVLVSTSGRILMQGDAASAYGRLFPRTTILTPNLPELAVLTGKTQAETEMDAITQGRALIGGGLRTVLVKGGHAGGDTSVDLLVGPLDVVRHEAVRINASVRGTGCALASAIAANLATGSSLPDSVSRAKAEVLRMIQAGVRS